MSESGGTYKVNGGSEMGTDQIKAMLMETKDTCMFIGARSKPDDYLFYFMFHSALIFHDWKESDDVRDLIPFYFGRDSSGVNVLEMAKVEFPDANSMVNCVPALHSLELAKMTMPSLAWIPQSVVHLTIADCTVRAWDCCFPNVILLYIHGCYIPDIPRDMDKMFPNLRLLVLLDAGIETLKGVVFPPKLQFLDLSENLHLSTRGVVFPDSIVSLRMYGCTYLDGFGSLRLPSGLRFFDFRECQVAWIGKKFVVPATLVKIPFVFSHGIDVRPFEGAVENHLRGLFKRRADYIRQNVLVPSMYDHDAGDAIVLMLFNNVLPWELLHLVYGFLV